MKRFFILGIYIITIILSSCLSDMPDSISSDSEMNTSIAFPLGETSLELNSISGFDERLLEINPLTTEPYWKEDAQVRLSFTMPFEIGNIYQNSEEIVELTFRLNMYNGFPSYVSVQLYFIDEFGISVDQLFDDGPIELTPATANRSGEITSKPHEQKDIPFSSDRIDNLQFVNRIMISVVFNTENIDAELVGFYDEYFVDVQIGVKAQLKFGI